MSRASAAQDTNWAAFPARILPDRLQLAELGRSLGRPQSTQSSQIRVQRADIEQTTLSGRPKGGTKRRSWTGLLPCLVRRRKCSIYIVAPRERPKIEDSPRRDPSLFRRSKPVKFTGYHSDRHPRAEGWLRRPGQRLRRRLIGYHLGYLDPSDLLPAPRPKRWIDPHRQHRRKRLRPRMLPL